jgi:hypothetical protein
VQSLGVNGCGLWQKLKRENHVFVRLVIPINIGYGLERMINMGMATLGGEEKHPRLTDSPTLPCAGICRLSTNQIISVASIPVSIDLKNRYVFWRVL